MMMVGDQGAFDVVDFATVIAITKNHNRLELRRVALTATYVFSLPLDLEQRKAVMTE